MLNLVKSNATEGQGNRSTSIGKNEGFKTQIGEGLLFMNGKNLFAFESSVPLKGTLQFVGGLAAMAEMSSLVESSSSVCSS